MPLPLSILHAINKSYMNEANWHHLWCYATSLCCHGYNRLFMLLWLQYIFATCMVVVVFTFHLQISQSSLILHHTLLMKLMALFPSQLLPTGHHPQQMTMLHCSTQWMAQLLVRDIDTNSTSALVLYSWCNNNALGGVRVRVGIRKQRKKKEIKSLWWRFWTSL